MEKGEAVEAKRERAEKVEGKRMERGIGKQEGNTTVKGRGRLRKGVEEGRRRTGGAERKEEGAAREREGR